MAALDPIQIIVNGDAKAASSENVDYEEVLALAGIDKEDMPITIHYRAAVEPTEHGELVKGESIKVQNGTIITARYAPQLHRDAAT